MPVFEYEVIDRYGRISKGQQEGVAAVSVRTNLAREGLFVITISRTGGGRVTRALLGGGGRSPLVQAWRDALTRLMWRVKITDLVLFTSQLAAMLGAGLHLLRGLVAVSEDIHVKHFKKAIEQVAADVERGESLTEALEKHPWAFDRTYVSLTRLGEASGQLAEVLSQHTIYLEKVAQLRRKIIGALSYPVIILSIALLIVSIMIVYIVPIFDGVYKQAKAPLPLPTQVLVTISLLIRSRLPVALLCIITVAAGVFFWGQTERGHRLFDRMKLHLPVFGPLIRKATLVKVCHTLSTLLNSGVPVLEALEIAAEVAGNRLIAEAINRTINEVKNGGTIADSFLHSGQFPSLIVQMTATGEETGKLPELLGKAALYYEQQVESTVNALSNLLEPLLIVTMGAIAGGIVIAIYLPIFNLGRTMGGVRGM